MKYRIPYQTGAKPVQAATEATNSELSAQQQLKGNSKPSQSSTGI